MYFFQMYSKLRKKSVKSFKTKYITFYKNESKNVGEIEILHPYGADSKGEEISLSEQDSNTLYFPKQAYTEIVSMKKKKSRFIETVYTWL